MTARATSRACATFLALWVSATLVVAATHRIHVPGVTMMQMKGSAACSSWDWPSAEFGVVYQDCHQLYGRLDFVQGAKTLKKLTLVGRDFANPDNIVVRIVRKRYDQTTGTFTNPEIVAEATTGAPVDELRSIIVTVPAGKAKIELGKYFYYLEATTSGPVEFAGAIVEYVN
jgi:hypothetical protein